MTQHRFRYLDSLIHVFVVVLLVSNLVGPKIVALGPFRISGAQLLFPITYIFGDVFTEVYGYAASRRAIWTGFFASALLSVMGLVTVALPPAPDWPNQRAFETVFHFVPRMVIASLAAYWAGEFANAYVMARLKLWTRGRHLWMRTIGSTAVGQGVDSLIFYPIAFLFVWTTEQVVTVMFTNYLLKVLWEGLLTPVTYRVVAFLKRAEGVDVYDAETDFTPFSVRT